MKHLFAIPFLALALCACSNDSEPAPSADPVYPPAQPIAQELTDAERRAAQATSNFGVDFLAAACAVAASPDDNVLVSPAGVQFMLSMLANVTDDAATKEITDLLGCTDVEALNGLAAKYMKLLPQVDQRVTTTVANALWYNRLYTLMPALSQELSRHYESVLFPFDPSDFSLLADKINAWSRENTDGMIDGIADPIDFEQKRPDAVFANAIYFNGKWACPFDAKDTRPQPFSGSVNRIDADMMNGVFDNQEVIAGEHYTAAKLQFGDKSFSAILVLPDPGFRVDNLIAAGELADIMSQPTVDVRLTISFPKFKYKMESPMDLAGALRQAGCSAVLKPQYLSIFENYDKDLEIDLEQKSAVEFDEEGAKAASVTIGTGATSPGPGLGKEVTLVFNRPFAFFICENSTNLILFAGKIMNL